MTVTIILTRPEVKNKALAKFILGQPSSKQVKIMCLPAFSIVPRQARQLSTEALASVYDLPTIHFIFFVSSVAVDCFFDVLNALKLSLPTSIVFGVVGKNSQLQLEKKGVSRHRIVCPEKGNDSEALLDTLDGLPYFSNFKKILIVRADTGRDWFSRTLQKRGKTVKILPVYQRVPLALTNKEIDALKKLQASDDVAWLFMSNESVDNSIQKLAEQNMLHLLKQHFFVVIHPKIAIFLKKRVAQCSHGQVKISDQQIKITSVDNTAMAKSLLSMT